MPILDTIEQFEKGYYGRSLSDGDLVPQPDGPSSNFWNIPARAWQDEEPVAPPPETGRGFFSGLAEGFGKTKGSELIPFIGAGVEAKGLYDLYESAKRVEAGNPTDEDVQKLKTVYDENTKQRGRAESIGYTTARILSQLPAFAGELMATSGLYYAGRKIGQEAALKAIGSVIDDAAEKAAARLASRVVGGAVGAAYQTIPATAPRIVGGTIERQTPRIAFDAEQKPVVTAPGEDFATAAVKSLGDQFIELLSERSGGMILQGLGKVPGVGALAGLQKAIADRWIRKTGGTFDQLLDTVQRGAGWHGVIGEILEERAGEVGRAALGIESYRPPTTDQLIAEAIAFSVPGAARAGISQASRIFERPQAAPPPRERTSYAVQKSQAEAAAPVETPATLPQVGQEVRQEDQTQAQEAPPVTTPLPGLESPAPPRVQPEVTPPPVAESSPSQAPRGPAAPVTPEPVTPIQEAPPPVPAPPPPVRTAAPDPVVRDLVGFLDIENPKLPRDTAFVHELPNPENKAELLPLAEIAKQPGGDTYLAQKATENAIKKATNSRKLSRKFIFLRHRETGEIRLAQIWKDQRKNFKILDPETGSGDGLEARTIIGPTGKWDPLSYMRLTVVSPELNQAITPEQYKAISDQAVEKTGGRFERPEGVAQVTRAATESQVSESESGLTNEQLQDWFEAVRDWRGKELNEEFLKQHIDLLQSAAATLDWKSSRLIKSLKQSFKKKPKTFDEFFEAFDPVGYDRRQSERRRGVGGLRGPSAPAGAAEAPPTRQVGATPPTVPPAAAPAPAPTPAAAPQPAPTQVAPLSADEMAEIQAELGDALALEGWDTIGPGELENLQPAIDISEITTVSDILARLPAFNPRLQPWLDSLLRLGLGATRLHFPKRMTIGGRDALGLFVRERIYLSGRTLADTELIQRVLLHELTHAATYKAVHGQMPPEFAARAAQLRSELTAILEEVRVRDRLNRYGLTNIDELLAESRSNLEFQAFINDAPPGQRSLLRRIIDAITRFLGLQDPTLLDQIFTISDELAALSGQVLQPVEGGAAMVGGPQVFRTPAQRAERLAAPGLSPEQIAENEAMANVQASIVPVGIATNIYLGSTDPKTEEGLANRFLHFLTDIRLVGTEQDLGTLPRTTPQEEAVARTAAVVVLAQAEVIQGKPEQFEKALAKKLAEQASVIGALRTVGRPTAMKEAFLKSAIDGLVEDYTTYLSNLTATAGRSANIAAASTDAVHRLAGLTDAYGQHHGSLVKALTVIANKIPPSILVGGNNQAVINWAQNSGVLTGEVGSDIITFLLYEKGPGLKPALETNRRLVKTLGTLRDLENNRIDAEKEIADFESWFAGFKPSATRKVDVRALAQRYFKWETERRSAAEFLRGLSKQAEKLDLEIRALLRAITITNEVIDHPDFQRNVSQALGLASVVSSDMMTANRKTGEKTYIGPVTGKEYKVKLDMEKATEQENLQNLSTLAVEIRGYLSDPNVRLTDRQKWEQRLEVIERHMLTPWFSPEYGLDRKWVIPFTGGKLRVGLDPFDLVRRTLASYPTSPQAPVQYIGGRAANDVLRQLQNSDRIDELIKQLHNDKDHGWAAVNNKVFAAAKAHGLAPEDATIWSERIAEPILASHQNSLSRYLKPGSFTVRGDQILPEDIVAIEAMKKWSDRILDITQRSVQNNPLAIKTKDSFLGAKIRRLSVGTGPFIMPRLFDRWAAMDQFGFAARWAAAENEAQQLDLLKDEENFYQAVMGRIVESNPEYTRKSEQQEFYTDMALGIEGGRLRFSDLDEVLSHLARERAAANGTNSALERNEAKRILLKDITDDVNALRSQLTKESETSEEAPNVPKEIVEVASANNEFTKPRIGLVAPSSYYTYSMAPDLRRGMHLASLKAVVQLGQLESFGQLLTVLEAKKGEYDRQIDALHKQGKSLSSARKAVRMAAKKAKVSGQTRFDYKELVEAINVITRQREQLQRMALEEARNIEHGVISLMRHLNGSLPKVLLGTPMAINKNVFGGVFAMPAIVNRTLGIQYSLFEPLYVSGRLLRNHVGQISSFIFDRFPELERVFRTTPGLSTVFWGVVKSADHWRKVYARALRREVVGGQYDYRQRVSMQLTRPGVSGRVEGEERGIGTLVTNFLFSNRVVAPVSEFMAMTAPRAYDELANVTNMETFERVMDKFRSEGLSAVEGRVASAAATGADWRDMTDPENLLTPEELGLISGAGLKYFRDMFAAAGGLEFLLHRYYDRVQAAAPAKPRDVPFLDPEEEAAVFLEYGKMTNIPTTSNRPLWFKGGGLRGDFRRAIFMFQGYGVGFSEQLSKLFHLTPKDSRWVAGIGIAGALAVILAIGTLAHEGSEELRELFTGEIGGRIRLANVEQPIDALRLGAISFANVAPWYGEQAARVLGSTTHRGSITDITSVVPLAGLIKEGVEAIQKTSQTGDPIYPATDFAKRWFFPARMALNRVPGLAGDVEARNAARAYTAALTPDQEARLTGGGAIRQTPVTPIIRSLLAAAYSGDQAGVELAFRNAVEERKALGDPDPERSVIASIQGRVPARTVLGRLPTESEEARTVARMNEDQRAAYMRSKDAMGLISQVTGKEIRTTAQEPMSLVQRRGLGRTRSRGRGLRLRTPRLRLRRVSLRSRRRGSRRVRGRTLRKRLV